MRAEVRKASDAAEYATDERCWIREVANDQGDEWVSIARARVEPGVTTAWHRLTDIAERYIMVQGEGRVQIGSDDPMMVGEGDVVRIPAGIRQRIENTGSVDLIFYAVCTPRFTPERYEGLE